MNSRVVLLLCGLAWLAAPAQADRGNRVWVYPADAPVHRGEVLPYRYNPRNPYPYYPRYQPNLPPRYQGQLPPRYYQRHWDTGRPPYWQDRHYQPRPPLIRDYRSLQQRRYDYRQRYERH
ncbi:hypothetical protein YO5_03277 [Stutzerimonas stutzeri TS44]|nr:hypothetical protein YO5_03277 [Stutzerimonas stutzeri TS44]